MRAVAVSPVLGARSLRDAWIVPGLLAGATAAAQLLDRHVSHTSQAMLYVLAVVLASYACGRVASIVCAVAAVTLLNFFFISPRYTFHVEAQENLFALLAMLAVALVISHLGTALRRETEAARLRERRARQLLDLAADLSAATEPEHVRVATQRCLAAAFAGPCRVAVLAEGGEPELPGDGPAAVRQGMQACVREQQAIGPGTGRWPDLDTWFIPLQAHRHTVGAASIGEATADDFGGLEHAQAICAFAGQALWRLTLSAAMRAALQESQWHRAQSTFLAAISHDFRTPLAAIVGAASSLQTQGGKLGPQDRSRLLATLLSEAHHLTTLTENTLQLARLDNAGEVSRDWQSMEEIVGSVLARVRRRDDAHRISSQVEPALPLVKADPVLLSQLLENLLDNALKYSAQAVELEVSRRNVHQMEVAVRDRGEGICAAQQAAIFEPYRRGDSSGKRGAGLGLAVCRAIARAHGGELTVGPRQGGGSCFVLTLPIDPAQPTAQPA